MNFNIDNMIFINHFVKALEDTVPAVIRARARRLVVLPPMLFNSPNSSNITSVDVCFILSFILFYFYSIIPSINSSFFL